MQKNFSNGVKNILLEAEKKVRWLWFKYLSPEDIFLEILEQATWGLKEIFELYGIDTKLVLEIISRWIINTSPDKRKWVYNGIDQRSKDVLLWALKVAASHNKTQASLEDLVIALMTQDVWLANFLEYVGINPSDIETNLIDLIQMWVNDGLGKSHTHANDPSKEGIEELFW